MTRQALVVCPAVLATALLLHGVAKGAVVRFHFVPADGSNQLVLQPGPSGAAGEWRPWAGSSRREPYSGNLRPNQLVTFNHPYTCRQVVVPLAMPGDVPQIQHVRDRVVFNYGSYTITVQFLADGSADVIYNSGFFRDL
jgi:hypothetical protein